MIALVTKILDAESLLDSVGMVHWLRQEDKIPEYEDLLTPEEMMDWLKMKPTLLGTPWENFKAFLLKMKDLYEEFEKSGTKSFDEDCKSDGKKCSVCKKKGHSEHE